jgi:hypothetical protein
MPGQERSSKYSKTIDKFFQTQGGLEGKGIPTQPPPTPGRFRLYPHEDGRWYTLDSEGNEQEIGIGEPGPAGPDTRFIREIAGEALGGNRVVIVDDDSKAYYADRSISSHTNRVLGITTSAVSQDVFVDIQIFGIMVEPSWNWTMELPIFLSTSGVLTQTAPTSGFILIMGFPVSSSAMMIEKGIPITLA